MNQFMFILLYFVSLSIDVYMYLQTIDNAVYNTITSRKGDV
jgi:hypothetical protein